MRKINLILLCVGAVAFSSCGPQSEITRKAKNVVYFNGINENEAVTIAEKKLIDSAYAPFYETTKAKVRDDEAAQKYPDYWFIDFSQGMLFDSPSYLVVIEKQNGSIIYTDQYLPKKISNLDWVFERAKSTNGTN